MQRSWPTAPGALVPALLASGCLVQADYDGTQFRCDRPDACPAGFLCSEGSCVEEIATGEVRSVETCDSAPGLLVDDFADGQAGPAWQVYAAEGTSAEETGGRLVLRPASSSNGRRDAGFRSRQPFDLRGRSSVVEVPSMVAVDGKAAAHFRYHVDEEHWVGFRQRHGQLSLVVRNDGKEKVGSLRFDPVNHRFWMLSEQDQLLRWSTSADGRLWDERGSAPTPAFLQAAAFDLGVSTSNKVIAPGEAQFDNLDGARRPCM
jgi:hypothetical protein